MGEPLVSICCITYNHEKFIGDALEGFVNQVTNFPFEVLIHDDASTDSTADIIRKYEKEYPDIIKPIYQTQNQYSLGNPPGLNNYKRAKGKYIAVCEGDDYWTDNHKLQKQFDYMESNTDCSLCVTGYEVLDYSTGKFIKFELSDSNGDFSTEEVIRGGGGLFATASMFYPAKYKVYDRPKEFKLKGIGDYPTTIYLSLKGRVHYLCDNTTVYRKMVPNSWNCRNVDIDSQTMLMNSLSKMLENINSYTNNEFNSCIKKTIFFNQIRIDLVKKDYKRVKLMFKSTDLVFNEEDYKTLRKNEIKKIKLIKNHLSWLLRLMMLFKGNNQK